MSFVSIHVTDLVVDCHASQEAYQVFLGHSWPSCLGFNSLQYKKHVISRVWQIVFILIDSTLLLVLIGTTVDQPQEFQVRKLFDKQHTLSSKSSCIDLMVPPALVTRANGEVSRESVNNWCMAHMSP